MDLNIFGYLLQNLAPAAGMLIWELVCALALIWFVWVIRK